MEKEVEKPLLSPPESLEGMESLTNLENTYNVISIGHWWSKRQIVIFRTGKELARHKATEHSLPRLAKNKRIREAKWGKKKIYTVSGSSNHIHHGLGSVECLVRLVASQHECEVIGEGQFRRDRNGVVPEFGLRYCEGTILLVEFCTRDNATRSGLISRKVNQYRTHLKKIEETYNAEAVVVFVIDLPVDDLKRKAGQYLRGLNFIYFTACRDFLKAPLGTALDGEIYFMADGNMEGLRDV